MGEPDESLAMPAVPAPEESPVVETKDETAPEASGSEA